MTTEQDNVQEYWDFCEYPTIVELSQQLREGLIHPIEYAHAIVAFAARLNSGLIL